MDIQPNTSSHRLYEGLWSTDSETEDNLNEDDVSLKIDQNYLAEVLKSNEIPSCAPPSRDAIDQSYLLARNFINQIRGYLNIAIAPPPSAMPTVPMLEEIELVCDMDDGTWYELATPQQDSDMVTFDDNQSTIQSILK